MRFLKKLKSQGKLKIIDISGSIVDSYLNKSRRGISAAEVLIKTGHLEEATSMVYYSMYYSTMALFFSFGIRCENHTGCILLLDKIFDQKELSDALRYAKEERIDKQYYTDYSITKQEIEEFIEKAQDFSIAIKLLMDADGLTIEMIKKKIKEQLTD